MPHNERNCLMLNTKLGMASLVLLGSFLATGASANTNYTWDLTNPSGNVGSSSHTYVSTSGNIDLGASGYVASNSAGSSSWTTGSLTSVNLYGKGNGIGSEDGLGLANDPTGDHEISGKSFLQLNVSDLLKHKLRGLNMTIGSIQSGEGYAVWGSNSAGTPGTYLTSYTAKSNSASLNSFLAPDFGKYTYYSISATSGNVLLDNGISGSPAVPEASSVMSMCGMLAIGGLSLRRRRTNKTA